MRVSRLYVEAPLAPGSTLRLAGGAAGHALRVLRLKAGDPLTLFNGEGGEFGAAIVGVRAGTLEVQLGEARAPARESSLRLTLAQGVSRAERMDLVIQKATELGVTSLVPVLSTRSVVRLSGEQAARKLRHWRAVIIAACEQCGRNRLPTLEPPCTLADLLRALPAPTTRLLLAPGAPLRIPDLPPGTADVTVLIGPEGGLAEEEARRCLAAGFRAVSLGPRILRTETAAFAALALLQREFGDL
ncbi:MAG: 16S rRNA (uracil(1498)-N(3))-methyltransferase [Gammaproteobacteria bacterium]|nr:16S rRNA (uracil(1498)-N(3))-methyltransferase [Gammaproteobacteria bacterium]